MRFFGRIGADIAQGGTVMAAVYLVRADAAYFTPTNKSNIKQMPILRTSTNTIIWKEQKIDETVNEVYKAQRRGK